MSALLLGSVAKLYKKLQEIEAKLDKVLASEEEEVCLIDWTHYKSVTGDEGIYRRVGSKIEFTADYPPEEVDIKTKTLYVGISYKTAEVIGWETKTVTIGECVLENETFLAQIEDGDKLCDTHNFCNFNGSKKDVGITIPITGDYNLTVTAKFLKGNVFYFPNVKDLIIEKE